MSRACVFLCLLFCGCGTTPRETIPLGGSTLSPVAAGNTFTYTFVLDNATNGVHAEGTIDGLSVPYSDSNIAGAVAEVMTMTSSKRTQNGFPIAFEYRHPIYAVPRARGSLLIGAVSKRLCYISDL